MHSAATWWELVAQTRLVADTMQDPAERSALLEVAAGYERAHADTDPSGTFSRCFGLYPSRVC